MAEFKHNVPHMIFWAGMTRKSFDLPYLLHGPVNAPYKAKILQV
jgi:hypothetical protein